MPEGPEVECTRLSLRRFEGKKIVKIELTKLSQKYKKYEGKQKIFDVFIGKTITEIERKGKFLIWNFDFSKVILNHLGMSGHWIISEGADVPTQIIHPKIKILFKNENKIAIFEDARNFGQFRIYDTYQDVINYLPIRNLGSDGLKVPFPQEAFAEKLKLKKNANKEIGRILLDQTLISGIGNIYKSESLALAKINPLRLVKKLKLKEIERLGASISIILHKAVDSMGSSIQSFRTSTGEEGSAQKWHKVYAKAGIDCESCGNKIIRIVQDKRSTFYCEKCQV
ncbi:MAG: bifunctional DNA-formamidopyrimidine glycosylase/DNA-(apurinic or apyrimidinic site) lyase [Candidatus Heimdallarchaeaceae archaeon]